MASPDLFEILSVDPKLGRFTAFNSILQADPECATKSKEGGKVIAENMLAT